MLRPMHPGCHLYVASTRGNGCASFLVTEINCQVFAKSAQVKLLLKSVQKLVPDCTRNALRESKFPRFSVGACCQTLLGGLWAYAHSLTVVPVHSQRSEPTPPPPPPPPTFASYSISRHKHGEWLLPIRCQPTLRQDGH